MDSIQSFRSRAVDYRVLCVCQYGHSRSVACSRVFHHAGIQAVAAGWQTGQHLIDHLARTWATDIVVMHNDYVARVPHLARVGIHTFHVGHDKWCNGNHPELFKLITPMAVEAFKIPAELYQ